MRKAIKAHKNLPTNQQNEHTPEGFQLFYGVIFLKHLFRVMQTYHGM